MAWSPTLHTSCRSELALPLDTEPAAPASSLKPALIVRAAHTCLFYCPSSIEPKLLQMTCTHYLHNHHSSSPCGSPSVPRFVTILNSLLSWAFQQPSPSPARTARLSWSPYPLPWPSSSWQCCSMSWLAGLSPSQSSELPQSVYTVSSTLSFYFHYRKCHNAQSSSFKNPAKYSVYLYRITKKTWTSVRCAHVKEKAKMYIYACGLSWQSFLFRETINPPLIIGLTYPHLAYKSWYYTHAHVNY